MSELVIIESQKSISEAWGKAFLKLYKKNEISPLIISATGFDNSLNIPEDQKIREALDQSLMDSNQNSVNTVANTIFPWSLWNPNKSRKELYLRHIKILPSIESCRANQRGHYFRRMIAYENEGEKINQIEKVLDLWNKSGRHSGLQLAFFDPKKDHIINPYMGFPCLHQISIDYYGSKGKDGMGLTAFYGTQHLYRKAYGNYLGLCRLGKFLAKEMNLKFVRFNCIAGKSSFMSGFKKKSKNTLDLITKIKSNI
jgi:thymidylate synthase